MGGEFLTVSLHPGEKRIEQLEQWQQQTYTY